MSVTHNEYAGYTLKHLLLRHMLQLVATELRATLLADPSSLGAAATARMSK